MIKQISGKIKNNKKIIENFSYLSLSQVFSLLFPIIAYPYLLKVLGSELYGEVIYAQTIATYFSILIAFGFNVSGAREAAVNRFDNNKLSEVFSTIMSIRIVFFIISSVIFTVILLCLDLSKDYYWLYIFSFLICLNDILFPQWFFQGIEKLKYITIVNLLIKLIFLSLIFVVIRNQSDYLLVPILNVIGIVVGGIVSLYVILVKENIKVYIPKLSLLLNYTKENIPLFLSNAVISIKDKFNIILIGNFLGMSDVAIYDLGMKLAGLLSALVSMINSAVFPRMAIIKSKQFLKSIILFSFLFISIGAFITILLLDFILIFIGKEIVDLDNAILSIKLLLICPVILSLSIPLVKNGLIIFKKYNLQLLGMFLTTIFYVLCISISYNINVLTNILSFIIITILTYIFELFYRLIICKKENIL